MVQGQALSAQVLFLQGQAHQKKAGLIEFNCITKKSFYFTYFFSDDRLYHLIVEAQSWLSSAPKDLMSDFFLKPGISDYPVL